MTEIVAGDRLIVTDSKGRPHSRRALTGVEAGEDMLVVWACREDEWLAAEAEARPPEGMPWPARDVQLAETGSNP